MSGERPIWPNPSPPKAGRPVRREISSIGAKNGVFQQYQPILQDFCIAANVGFQEEDKNLQQGLGFGTGFLEASNEVVCACSKKEGLWRALERPICSRSALYLCKPTTKQNLMENDAAICLTTIQKYYPLRKADNH